MRFKTTMLAAVGAFALALAAACGEDGDGQGSLESGTVVATEGGLQGGRIWFIWEGSRQRIQQPAGLSEADLGALGYTQGEAVTRALTVGDAPDSRWAVFPPTGSEARLWLVYENVMHEVTPLEVDIAEVEKLPDAEELIITRVRLPGD